MHRGSGTPSADQQRSDLLYCISDEGCHKTPLDGDLLGALFILVSISAGAMHVNTFTTSAAKDCDARL